MGTTLLSPFLPFPLFPPSPYIFPFLPYTFPLPLPFPETLPIKSIGNVRKRYPSDQGGVWPPNSFSPMVIYSDEKIAALLTLALNSL